MNAHLHPVFQAALAPYAPPAPTTDANERLRDKIWDEHASGLDGSPDEPSNDEEH
jgi:hypothetical protein